MKQKAGKLRVLLLSVLLLIVCTAASVFVGINFGDKLFAFADALEVDPETGYTIIRDDDGSKGYFNTYKSGSNVNLSGLSEKVYKMLGVSPYLPGAIHTPIKMYIPSNVTKITGSVFYDFRYLKSLVLPEGLKTLGYDTFSFTGITELNMPANLTKIEYSSFRYNVLEKITVAEGNTAYKTDENGTCLLNKAGTTLICSTVNLVIPETVVTIDGGSLCNLNLKSIKIPSNVTNIGAAAASYASLEDIDLSKNNNFEVVGTGCVVKKSAPKTCVLGFGKEVTVPTSVTGFLNDALSLSSIKVVNLHSGITLTTQTIRAPYLEKITMSGESDKYSVDQYGNLIENQTIDGEVKKVIVCGVISGLIPDDIYKIADRAYYTRQLRSITIPQNIKEIGNYAFELSALENFNCHNGLTAIDDVVGATPYFYNAANYDAGNIFYIGNYLMKITQPIKGAYTVRKSTTNIAGGVFNNFTELTDITLPDNILNIGSNAFSGCTGLQSVTLPKKLTKLGYGVFNECTNLKTVSVPASLKTVETGVIIFPAQTCLIAPDAAGYEKLKAGALKDYASQLTYETTVTVNVGSTRANVTRLANNTLGYKKSSGGLWTDSGAFEVGGIDLSDVTYWTVNDGSTHYTTAQLASYKLPIDGSAVTLTAYAADDTTNIPVTLVKPEVSDLEITYGTSEQFSAEEEYEGLSYSTMKVTYQGEGYAESEQIPYECGEYTVTVYPMIADWKDTSDNQAYVLGTLTIKPAEAQVIWLGVGDSTSDFEYVYDGKSHLPTAYFIDVNGDKVWLKTYISLADGDGIAANIYTAQLVIVETDFTNYTFTGSMERVYTVAQREVVVTWSEETLFDYLGYAVVPELSWTTDYNDGSFTVEYSLTAKEGSELTEGKAVMPGDYTITLTLTGSDNYCINADSLTFEFTIDQPGVGIIYWENVEFAYDGTIKLPTAFYYDPLNDNEKTYITEGVIGGAYNAGTHMAKMSAWVLAKYNLKGVTECKYTILKKEVNIEWDIELEFVYNGKLQKPVAYITGVNGERIMLDVTVDGGIDAGEYTAIVSAQTFANYAIVGGDYEKVFNIEKKTLTAVWTGSEFEYDGEEQTATFSIAGYKGSTTVEYYTLSGEKLSGKPVEVGTYVMKVTLDDSNYELTNGNFTFSIEPVGSITTKDGGLNWLVIGLIIAIGTVALIAFIALIAALRRRKTEEDDGFNDLAYDSDGFYDNYNG